MVSIPFATETQEFASKAEAKAFFKEMLNRYKPVGRVNDEDARHLAALLKRHPEYEQKVGGGIDHLFVAPAPYDPTHCFWIYRTDGSREDFSTKHCIEKGVDRP